MVRAEECFISMCTYLYPTNNFHVHIFFEKKKNSIPIPIYKKINPSLPCCATCHFPGHDTCHLHISSYF